jgi:predicted small metal-binding protein
MPQIRCADIGDFGRCQVVVSASTNDHAIARISDHLTQAHGMTSAWFTPARRDRLYAVLREPSGHWLDH